MLHLDSTRSSFHCHSGSCPDSPTTAFDLPSLTHTTLRSSATSHHQGKSRILFVSLLLSRCCEHSPVSGARNSCCPCSRGISLPARSVTFRSISGRGGHSPLSSTRGLSEDSAPAYFGGDPAPPSLLEPPENPNPSPPTLPSSVSSSDTPHPSSRSHHLSHLLTPSAPHQPTSQHVCQGFPGCQRGRWQGLERCREGKWRTGWLLMLLLAPC